MDASFWHQRWQAEQIGFHQKDVNPMLMAYAQALALTKSSRVFVPLCGKTLDIAWLLANGWRVAGAELSELAVKQLFAELGTTPDITDLGAVKRYAAADIDIFVGDIFDLTRDTLGTVDAVFDRAALVALPGPMRVRYAGHLTDVTDSAPQLLITYEYDQTQMDGPPFSVTNEEVRLRYQDNYKIASLNSSDVAGGLKGKCAATENVWLLQRLNAD